MKPHGHFPLALGPLGPARLRGAVSCTHTPVRARPAVLVQRPTPRPPDLTAGRPACWMEPRPPRSGLCWPRWGWDPGAGLDLLSGLLPLAPLRLCPPSCPSRPPPRSGWPPDPPNRKQVSRSAENRSGGLPPPAGHPQTSACSSRRRSRRRSPVCGRGSGRAASGRSSRVCRRTAASGTSSGRWRTQLGVTEEGQTRI